jgi:deoxyribonuclease V
MALRSRTNVSPIFVSPGHLVSFEDAYSIVMQCLTDYKLPMTTRVAHNMVNRLRKGEVKAGYSEQ